MRKQEVCSFFVSKFHLLTIILPYINEKICEGKNVKIISQIDLSDDVKKYLSAVKKFESEKIKRIFMKKQNDDIEENAVVFYIGDEEYINKNIKETIAGENIKCYEIKNVISMKKILSENEYYLKTEGKVKIENNSQNEQNTNTLKAQL